MLAHSFLPFLFCFLAQLVSVSSSPLVVERAAATCSAKDIATVKRTTPDAVYFCQWWQQDVRTRSPFMEFSATQVDTLCKCISPVATGPKCRRKRKRSNIEERAEALARTAASCSSEVSKQFTQPYRFCTFYTSYPRTTSPFKQYTASALTSLCKCAITKPATTTSKKATTTSKKVSTTTQKATTTSKKVTTAQKPVTTSKKTTSTSTKKPTSTSTKKPTTSSTKKPTTTSTKKPTTTTTSIKKAATTSTKKPSTTSTKKVTSTSTKKPTVTSTKKPATTSTKAVSSTTKKPTTTSIRKTTSSTKPATTSSKK
ncbi:hypothetical protein M436DRAFT_66163 [Aureobasidium namibiae CBS 147.97]|uniref:Uncharacterized protein n=1 Tax=Aureobasidium namibiae CBS 147.97 TaxID=1043004 RepID=A0A074WLV6_9PEZI|nr:uncharacterized protein M436DRAFT_66163 [Aureobasidium namibiae CBS 147.97]KEQ70762.1 hypothetical protein M436DRAFT_66163 [Aureobasidium namibiae CBS 147.97]